ncbi:hypothetical protein VTL71DRAFT_2074 [Oculimacula yallundae]|uniref:Fungal N-terminal domain-containing protein n=1 Tax=Oculimacula yallundae TaxID=86028 RepID=A0ABR4C7U3_9HELO
MEVAIAITGITIQLADTLHKLIVFYKDVQRVPADVRSLFEDVQTLSTLLAQAQSTRLNRSGCLDEPGETILKGCNEKIQGLYDKIRKSSEGLTSESKRKRKWSAFKISLDKADINDLRTELRDAKSLLVNVQLDGFERSTNQSLRIQGRMLFEIHKALGLTAAQPSDIMSWASLEWQSSDVLPLSSATSDSNVPRHSEDRQTTLVDSSWKLAQTTELQFGFQKELQVRHPNIQSQAHLEEISPYPRKSSHRSRAEKPQWSYASRSLINTPFGSVTSLTRVRGTAKIVSSRTSTEDRQSTHVFYPSWLLQRLGLSYGVWIQGVSTNGWQCNIRLFNTVPKDAPIFKYCREGNLSAVQTLLTSGYASVRDRDPNGRTPLSYASMEMHVEVADYLLKYGADPHAIEWQHNLSAIAESLFHRKNDNILELLPGFLSTYERHSQDGYDDNSMMTFINTIVTSYKPRLSHGEDHDKDIMIMISRVFELWLPNSYQRTGILRMLLECGYSNKVIEWFMYGVVSIEGSKSLEVLLCFLERGYPAQSLPLIKMLLDGIPKLHQPVWGWGRARSFISCTMKHPSLFFAWRNLLLDCGYLLDVFTKQELNKKHSRLAFQGWSQETLLSLLRSQNSTVWSIDAAERGYCHRCGRKWLKSWCTVDLQWLRYLQSVREGKLNLTPTECMFTSTVHGTRDKLPPHETSAAQNIPQNLSSDLTPLPYRKVCDFMCKDRICVSDAFESTSEKPAFLPPYPYKKPDQEKFEVRLKKVASVDSNDCPTKTMPGAFGE